MRQLILGLALLALPSFALAQGMPGGGMGGGGGGGGGGGMGGGHRGGGGEGRNSDPSGIGIGGVGGPERPKAELKAISKDKIDKPVEAMFRAADANGDGIVTIDELRAALTARRDVVIRERFKTIDRNGDKIIDESEFIAWQELLGSLALSDIDAGGIDISIVPDTISPPLGKSPEDNALRLAIEPLSATVLADANTNFDGGVSRAELLAYEQKRFDEADINHDGWLSLEELRSLEPRGGRFGGRGMRGSSGDGPKLGAPPEGRPAD